MPCRLAPLVIALLSVALAVSALGNMSRRASRPNPVNGPVRVLSEAAR